MRARIYPIGWFLLMPSHRARGSRPLRLRRLGRELVVFRDAAGAAVVADAFCPHLGADLGGGRIVDGALRCPFHGFRFGEAGRCVHVPELGRVPERLALAVLPVREVQGALFAWFHPEGEAPANEPPLPFGDEDGSWSAPTFLTAEIAAADHLGVGRAQRSRSMDEPVVAHHRAVRTVPLETRSATFVTPIDHERAALTILLSVRKPRAVRVAERAVEKLFGRSAS